MMLLHEVNKMLFGSLPVCASYPLSTIVKSALLAFGRGAGVGGAGGGGARGGGVAKMG